MRPKYVEECVGGCWFIFGDYKDSDKVDVSNSHGDVFTKIPRSLAEKLIVEQNKFLVKVADLLKEAGI